MKPSNDGEWLGERLLLVMWLVQRIKVNEEEKKLPIKIMTSWGCVGGVLGFKINK